MTVKGDPETGAIRRIEFVMRSLNEQQRSRILDWLQQRYRLDNVYLSLAAHASERIGLLEERLAELGETVP